MIHAPTQMTGVHSVGLTAVLLVVFVSGCVTSGPHDWGADATWRPSATTLRSAVVEAATDTHVWLPLAGAALFQIDGWDRKLSNKARRETSVFGSQESADAWSDRLRSASTAAYFLSVFLTPDPHEAGPWVRDKAQGLLVGLGAIGVTDFATSRLKDSTGRLRPNGMDRESFPSGHVSHSAVVTAMAHDNLKTIDMSPLTRRVLDVGLDALTAGTAWARIEAGAHFPSDTLFSIALGNFVGQVADAAFLGLVPDRRTSLYFTPVPRGFEVQAALQW